MSATHRTDLLDAAGPVIVVEANPSGHRLSYVRVLVTQLSAGGRDCVILTTAAARNSMEWDLHLGDWRGRVDISDAGGFELRGLAAVADKHSASVSVIPDGDNLLASLARHGWAGHGIISVLVMRPDGQGRRGLAWMKSLAKRALMVAAGARKDVRVRALRSAWSAQSGFLRTVPDPVSVSFELSDLATIADEIGGRSRTAWAGVFGVVNERKNLDVIIDALVDRPDIGLLVVGAIPPSESQRLSPHLNRLRDAGGSFVHIPPPVTDEMFDAAIASVDCVVAAHSNEGPSGVVAKAALIGKPLVLAGARSLRKDARTLRDAEWVPLDPHALRVAIGRAVSKPAHRTSDHRSTLAEFSSELMGHDD